MSGSNRSYSFRISAEGMKEFAADVRKLSGESDLAHAAFSKLIQASPQLASALTAAEEATKKAADRTRELREAQDRAAAAAAALPSATARAAEGFGQIESRTQAAGRALNDFRGALELLGAGRVASSLGPVGAAIGNAADLFGTASTAATVFGGSLSALSAVAVPLAVVVAGVGAAVALVASNMEAQQRAAENARAANEAYSAAIEISNRVLRGYVDTAADAASAKRAEEERTLGLTIALERETLARANAAAAILREDEARVAAAQARGLAAPSMFSRADQRAASAAGIATIAEQASARLAQYEVTLQNLRLMQYPAPIGPEFRGAGGGGGGGGRAADTLPDLSRTIYEAGAGTVFPVDALDGPLRAAAEAQRRAVEQAERLREQQERAEQDRLRRLERASVESFARIGENAVDRIGTALVQSFVSGERAAVNFGGVVRGVIASAASDLFKLGVANPLANSLFGLERPTLGRALGGGGGGGFGGFGDLLGLGSSLNGLMGGGIGASISNFMAAPLFGQAALSSATNSALGAMGGAYGPATASQLGIGGTTIGGALGGIGGGFMIGSTLGGLVAGNRTSRQTNAQIGAGLGSGIGFLVGGPIGALIGGAGGGLLGGLIGPANSNRAGDADFDFGTGQFTIGGQTGKKFSQANRDAALGLGTTLRDSLFNIAAATGATLPEAGGFRVGVGDRDGLFLRLAGQEGRRFDRSDAGAQQLLGAALRDLIPGLSGGRSDQFRGALATAGATSAEEIGGIAAWFANVLRPLTEIREPVDEFAEAMKVLNQTYDDAIKRARELGLQEAELQAGRQRAVAELEQQRRNGALGALTGPVSGLADFVRGLRVANDNPLSPNGRLDAARADFEATIGRALEGDLGAFARVQGSAQSLLAVSRDVQGSGTGFAADFEATLARLDSLSGLSEDRLTAAVYAAEMRSQTDVFREEIGRLRAEIVGLRAEVQQGNRIPSRFVA